MRSQENFFFVKGACHGVFTESLQRPWRCYGVRMAFYRVPTEFLLTIFCALTTLSLRFQSAHNSCTALSRRSHCADGVLETQWHLEERCTISVQTPGTTTAFAQRSLCAPAELLLRCRRSYCAALATKQRPHCAGLPLNIHFKIPWLFTDFSLTFNCFPDPFGKPILAIFIHRLFEDFAQIFELADLILKEKS